MALVAERIVSLIIVTRTLLLKNRLLLFCSGAGGIAHNGNVCVTSRNLISGDFLWR